MGTLNNQPHSYTLHHVGIYSVYHVSTIFPLIYVLMANVYTMKEYIYIYSPYSIELIEQVFWASDPEIGCPTNWVMHSRCFLYSVLPVCSYKFRACKRPAHRWCPHWMLPQLLGIRAWRPRRLIQALQEVEKAMSGRTSRINKTWWLIKSLAVKDEMSVSTSVNMMNMYVFII